MDRDIKAHVKRDYPIKLRALSAEDGGGWLAEIPDLPGCMSDGETKEEALHNLDDAKETWIRTAVKRGLGVPSPSETEETYSGRLTLRLPRTLHRRLAELAEAEGSSLNQFILSMLAFESGALFSAREEKAAVIDTYQHGHEGQIESWLPVGGPSDWSRYVIDNVGFGQEGVGSHERGRQRATPRQ